MKLKREIDKENESKRYFSFLIIVSFVFSLLIGRLFYLQVIKGDYYKEKAYKNSIKNTIIKATRGKIYDVKGELLAENSVGYRLIHRYTPIISSSDKKILLEMKNNKKNIDDLSEKRKEKIENLFFDIEYMSKILNQNFEELLDIFYTTRTSGFDREIVVEEDLNLKKALKLSENLPNNRIDVVEYDKRAYIKKELASHVIGFVKNIDKDEYDDLKDSGYNADDLIGKKGIEKYYDKRLKGTNGFLSVEVDARGRLINKLDEIKPIKGEDIYLTIDSDIQRKMTDYMKNTPSAFIAIDVKTGKILTMVSSPEIDSNILSSKIEIDTWNKISKSKKTPLINKAIAGLYPPGSTFKIVTGLALLEYGISPYTKVNSTGKFEYGKVIFKDSHINGHGMTNFYKSIEESVNSYYYNLSIKMPKEHFEYIANEFNIGKELGIDISGELHGLFPTEEWKEKRFSKKRDQIWLPGDTINMSIGQGYLLVTPLQILMVYQAIANNGNLMTPILVDKFVNSSNEIIMNEPKLKRKLKISEKNLKIAKDALILPVKGKNGTAKRLNLDYVNVSAKTGTAQNSSGDNHSWIAGYFPSEDPKIAFVSFVQNGGYGGVAAANQAKEFIANYYNKGDEKLNGEKNNDIK